MLNKEQEKFLNEDHFQKGNGRCVLCFFNNIKFFETLCLKLCEFVLFNLRVHSVYKIWQQFLEIFFHDEEKSLIFQ